MNKIDWKAKLSSRKFWAAVAGFVAGIILACNGTPATAETVTGIIMSAASIVTYILAEAATDRKRAEVDQQAEKEEVVIQEDDDDDPIFSA